MKSRIHSFFVFLLFGSLTAQAQIGINGSAHPSAALDVKSPGNNKVFYPPRLTTAQRSAIANPQAGALVYDTDKGAMYLHNGQNWLPLATQTDAQSGSQPAVQSLGASDGRAGDSFGLSVAMSGNYAVVGASAKMIGNKNSQGAAYIFVRADNAWVQQQMLVNSDGEVYDNFGTSVAISGDYAVVGARSKGAAYVFLRTGITWTQQQKLVANDGTKSDEFGVTVAIAGDYILVGAPSIDFVCNSCAVYCYTRVGTTWTQQQQLVNDDGAYLDQFGCSVALSGDYALIGAYHKGINNNYTQGAAYIFSRATGRWLQQQRLLAVDGGNGDFFGSSVAIEGDDAIIGAKYRTEGNNIQQGAAYIFGRSGATWSLKQKLVAPDGKTGDFFGHSVAIWGNYAVVGAPAKMTDNNSSQGGAYVFKRQNATWTLLRSIIDAPTGSDIGNGYSVGSSNYSFIIGGPYFLSHRGKIALSTVE